MYINDSPDLLQYLHTYELAWPPTSLAMTPNVERLADLELIHLIQSGRPKGVKQEAFGELYNRYHRDVWRFISSKGLAESDAKDVFCDVWETALRKLPTFNLPKDGVPQIKSWLFSIINNKLHEHWRANKNDAVPIETLTPKAQHLLSCELALDAEESIAVPNPVVQAQADQLLIQVFGILNQQEKEVLTLIYFHKKNSSEIAVQLGMKPGSVRKKHSDALDKIAKKFGVTRLKKITKP